MTPSKATILWLLAGAGLTACYHFWSGESSSASPDRPSGMSQPAKHASPRPAFAPSSETAARLAARSDTAEGLQALATHLAAWAAEDEAAAHHWIRGWIVEQAAQAEPRASGLLGEFARNGESAFALRIAGDLAEPIRGAMVDLTLSIQAATAPLEAWRAAAGITDAGLRERGQLAVLTHGSDSHLPQLADFATQIPVNSEVMAGILKRWALQDPATLSGWLNAHAVAPQAKDLAASHLVLRGDSENRSAEVAAAWAESISDSSLRLEAMRAATQELARQDPDAAHAYLAACSRLTAGEKAAISSTLDAAP
jgi:hypothetical protein